jgi:hypothetical protein
VQVRAGAPARAAGGADSLAGDDLVADLDAPAREVCVERDVPPAECDFDDVPVALEATPGSHRDHAARLRRADDRRAQDPDVDPWVPTAEVVAER